MTLPAVPVSQSPEAKFREYLATRPKPQRYTEPQREIVRFIFAQHDHFDADQLIDDLKSAGLDVSRATVYRTLPKLVEAGLLRCFEVGPRTYYEHDYGYPRHEHLYCERCKKMIEFQHPAIEAAIREMAEEHGFQVSGHSLVIRGVCGSCNRVRGARNRLDLV